MMFINSRNCRIAIASIVSILFSCPTALSKDEVAQSKPTGQKRALVIGISTYDKFTKNHPRNLHCDKDVQIVTELLQSKFDFPANNIKKLQTPEETTKKAILAAFDELRSQTGQGDIVHIHYSGHGSRIEDPTNRKSDGFAESLAPSDTDVDDETTEIRDAEIALKINSILEKDPKLLSMTLDCCHSGTLTRDVKENGITRGFPSRMAAKAVSRSANANPFVPASQPLVLSARKNVVVLAACRPDQLAGEWPRFREECGFFTHALQTALNNSSNKKNYTYEDLLSDMSTIMVNDREDRDPQVPQLDGPRNNLLMSTIAIPTDNAYTVEHSKDNKLSLDAGSIMGMTAGSKFDLYANDVKDFKNSKPIASAEIVDNGVALAKSELKITSGGKAISDKADTFFLLRGVERARKYQYPIKVSFNGVDKSTQNELWEQIKDTGFKLSDGSNWDVQFSGIDRKIEAKTDSDRSIWSADLANDSTSRQLQLDEMSFALHKEAMRHSLHEMQHDNGKLDVKINIIPVTGNEIKDRDGEIVLDPVTVKEVGPKNPSALKDGDSFRIELVNNSDRPLYMSVFDAQSDGTISPLFPTENTDQSLGDNLNLVNPHTSWVIPDVSMVAKPFGVDRFKVVATTSKHDFRPLFRATTRGPAKTDENPLVKLLAQVRDATRGSRPTHVDIDEDDWVVAKMDLLTQPK